jgi:hypothetical protein
MSAQPGALAAGLTGRAMNVGLTKSVLLSMHLDTHILRHTSARQYRHAQNSQHAGLHGAAGRGQDGKELPENASIRIPVKRGPWGLLGGGCAFREGAEEETRGLWDRFLGEVARLDNE